MVQKFKYLGAVIDEKNNVSHTTQDEATNFVFVQLIEQEPGIYDKRHSDSVRQDKIDLAWERISHETKQSRSRLISYDRCSLNCSRRTDAPIVFFF
jgi:hypothetical protein